MEDSQCIWKAKENVKENDQCDGNPINHISVFAHPERSWWYILSSAQEVREYGKEVAHGGENNEGADQVDDRGSAAQLNRTKARAQDCAENRRLDGTRKLLVDTGEEARERCRVVAS